MSLTSFVDLPEVRERLNPLIACLPRALRIPIKFPPMTKSHMLVGTAFDYALRFELQRRFPYCEAKRWVAEAALEDCELSRGQRKVVKSILEAARRAVGVHLERTTVERAHLEEMASHAVRLAKVDGISRSGVVDEDLAGVDPAAQHDIANLLEVVPFTDLSHPSVLHLNPVFASYSALVGGADADLIAGAALIDFKVTGDSTLRAEWLRQLLGYFILARGARLEDPTFPEIRRLGVYFARHGYLWTARASAFMSDPSLFAKTEAWFVREAERRSEEIKAELMAELEAFVAAPRRKRKRVPKGKPPGTKVVKRRRAASTKGRKLRRGAGPKKPPGARRSRSVRTQRG